MRGALLFDPLDGGAQPGDEGFLQLLPIVPLFGAVHSLPAGIQGNVMAGYSLVSELLGDEINQQALIAGMHLLGFAEIQAAEGILED